VIAILIIQTRGSEGDNNTNSTQFHIRDRSSDLSIAYIDNEESETSTNYTVASANHTARRGINEKGDTEKSAWGGGRAEKLGI